MIVPTAFLANRHVAGDRRGVAVYFVGRRMRKPVEGDTVASDRACLCGFVWGHSILLPGGNSFEPKLLMFRLEASRTRAMPGDACGWRGGSVPPARTFAARGGGVGWGDLFFVFVVFALPCSDSIDNGFVGHQFGAGFGAIGKCRTGCRAAGARRSRAGDLLRVEWRWVGVPTIRGEAAKMSHVYG